VIDEPNEGLIALLGKNVLLMCANYFYSGKLIGVNDTCVKLEDPSIVYDTGSANQGTKQDAEKMAVREWYVSRAAIESFGLEK
jgi:hypothetical protein